MTQQAYTGLPEDEGGEFIGRDLVRHAKRQKKTYEVIHRAGCRHAKHPLPWNWAEGRPVTEWLTLVWFEPCKACLPELQDYYTCCGLYGGCGGPCAAFPSWELTT